LLYNNHMSRVGLLCR